MIYFDAAKIIIYPQKAKFLAPHPYMPQLIATLTSGFRLYFSRSPLFIEQRINRFPPHTDEATPKATTAFGILAVSRFDSVFFTQGVVGEIAGRKE